MNRLKTRAAVLRAAADQIEREPELYDQDTWCGTACCAAGHIVDQVLGVVLQRRIANLAPYERGPLLTPLEVREFDSVFGSALEESASASIRSAALVVWGDDAKDPFCTRPYWNRYRPPGPTSAARALRARAAMIEEGMA